MERQRLTAAFVRSVRKPGVYGDGPGSHGLRLRVRVTDSGKVHRAWVQRLRFGGRETALGLGAYPTVTLAEARQLARDNAEAVRQGRHPRADATVPTVAEALAEVVRLNAPSYRERSGTAQEWERSLEKYGGAIMNTSVAKVTSGDVLRVLTPLWHDMRPTARNLRGRISAIMAWSIVNGYRTDNPARDVIDALPRNGQTEKRHHRSVHHSEIADVIKTVRQLREGFPAARLALEYAALTVARSQEVRLAEWREVDFDARVWTQPGAHTKTGRPHRVPLADQAVRVLREARSLSDGGSVIFPSNRAPGKPFGAKSLRAVAVRSGFDFTPHGLRSSFRSWCAERGESAEVAEACLAHVTLDAVERAYQRSDMLDRRRGLMARWADHILPVA